MPFPTPLKFNALFQYSAFGLAFSAMLGLAQNLTMDLPANAPQINYDPPSTSESNARSGWEIGTFGGETVEVTQSTRISFFRVCFV